MENPKSATTGDIYLNGDLEVLDKLDALKSLHVFIIQRKAAVSYFSSKLTYDILDTRRNMILQASKPKSIFSNKKACKISVRNLRNVKLFSVVVEPTCNFESLGTEASVYLSKNIKIAHVEKYGGTVGPPSFEIFNVDRKTAFTIDNSSKKPTASSTAVEYDVNTKAGVVASIMMKTGLNYVLSTDPRMPTIEKASLLGVILAMDLLQTGLRERGSHKEPTSNQYLFN